jgi:hypothetical protein
MHYDKPELSPKNEDFDAASNNKTPQINIKIYWLSVQMIFVKKDDCKHLLK